MSLTVTVGSDVVTIDLPSSTDPISFATVADAKKVLHLPADANYVTWSFGNLTLEEAFMTLGTNDVLVLPERDTPYLIDSADGFRAAGVTSTSDGVKVANTYKGKTARTWFAMARAQRGILGLGPNARIQVAPSSFTQGKQAPPPRTTNQGWALTGAVEKLIDYDSKQSVYFGNFTITGRNFGGVAYNTIDGASTVGHTFERISFKDAAYGFATAPNGESGNINTNGGTVALYDLNLDGRDSTGARQVPSVVMLNSATSATFNNVTINYPLAGGFALWKISGAHTWSNVSVLHGSAGNLEGTLPGMSLTWQGGQVTTDYQTDAPDGSRTLSKNGGVHLSMAPRTNLVPAGTSAKIDIRNVTFDPGPGGKPGITVLIWAGGQYQNTADFTGDLPYQILRTTQANQTA